MFTTCDDGVQLSDSEDHFSSPQCRTISTHLSSSHYSEAYPEVYHLPLATLSDAPSSTFSERHSQSSTSVRFTNDAPPLDSASYEPLVPPQSLLFSGEAHYLSPPSLNASHPSRDSPFLFSRASELRSRNYSPRFPDGHHLDPLFAHTYLLGDELGSGGYGFVMTALHRQFGHDVAVKFVIKEKVPEQAWVNDDRLGRIPMEIMLLKIINHENVVKWLDLFQDQLFFYVVQELHGSPWHKRETSYGAHHSSPEIAMTHSSPPLLSPAASEFSAAGSEPETPPQPCDQLSSVHMQSLEAMGDESVLCDQPIHHHKSSISLAIPRPQYSRRPSHDLFECIEQTKHKRLSEKQARYIMAQVVEAVHYLHHRGICHRDIKDENLVIDKDFKVKLIDFGSATMVDPNKPSPFYKLFFGTTAYAASEVLLKRPYQAPPAEIWTLGVLMSYLLTGMSPFPTEKDAIEGRIVLAELPGKKLSNSCLHLMSRCLEPEPSLRADIDEVRSHRWLEGTLNGV
ncbi:kinase-like domain-containing protein [Phlebopus sp. FC_14]|nr:kinase-like domain-containing protein [Phlebopus sp. FC_14]